ncbi:hypothetical protein J2T15_002938 [Paenibacillus harenae]|uniref:Uncharacterized protein n=1 Tax=Paenibacillus harenae TaxID=306543 RepID=A0ABT9U1J0_PAEHA|nr:hypothetical protein [Paenibacillus harenae]
MNEKDLPAAGLSLRLKMDNWKNSRYFVVNGA